MQQDQQQQQQTTEHRHHGKCVALNRSYVRKPTGGILRLIECCLDLVVIITASINLAWVHLNLGGGWVEFVGSFGLIVTLIVFFFYLCNVIPRLPAWWPLCEFIINVSMSGLYLIAFIVAAVRASQLDASVGVCAAFCFLAMAAYVVDSVFTGRLWRAGHQAHSNKGQAGPTAVVVTNTYSSGGQSQATMEVQSQPTAYNPSSSPPTYDANSAWNQSSY